MNLFKVGYNFVVVVVVEGGGGGGGGVRRGIIKNCSTFDSLVSFTLVALEIGDFIIQRD